MTSAEPLAAVVEPTAPWCRVEPVLSRTTLGGVVVLPVYGGPRSADGSAGVQPVVLRGPAVGIWELLVSPMTTADLVTAVADAWGVGEEQVAGDVRSALDTLLELGALCRG